MTLKCELCGTLVDEAAHDLHNEWHKKLAITEELIKVIDIAVKIVMEDKDRNV